MIWSQNLYSYRNQAGFSLDALISQTPLANYQHKPRWQAAIAKQYQCVASKTSALVSQVSWKKHFSISLRKKIKGFAVLEVLQKHLEMIM